MYTYAQLKRCKKKVLLELVRYHGLGQVSARSRKGEIIDHILEQLHADKDSRSVNEPLMSVRVRRIKELNRSC